MNIDYAWRGSFENGEVNALHAEGFGHQLLDDDWQSVRASFTTMAIIFAPIPWPRARAVTRVRCEWLHVDFDHDLRQFYIDASGFTPVEGGVIPL